MTPPPSSSPLVEKAYLELRTACGADREYRGYSITDRDLRRAALAAVRVVVEAAAEVCDREHRENLDAMEGAGSPEFELHSGAESAADRLAYLIRNLLPSEPEA